MIDFDNVALEYESWYYAPKGKYLSKLQREAILDLMVPKKGDILLDVGCGTGYFSYFFNSLGLKVTGIDSSSRMLQVARNKGGAIQFALGDAHKLDFPDNSFDIVTLITTLEFCKDPKKVLQEAYRVARRKLVLGVLNKLSWMNIERKFKKKSVYKRADFYTPWGLKRLIKSSLPDLDFKTGRLFKMKIPFCAFIVCRIDKIPQE